MHHIDDLNVPMCCSPTILKLICHLKTLQSALVIKYNLGDLHLVTMTVRSKGVQTKFTSFNLPTSSRGLCEKRMQNTSSGQGRR